MLTDAFRGAGYMLRGFRLISRRGLRVYALIPLLIALAVFAGLAGVGASYYGALLDWILPGGDQWWAELLRTLLWPLFAAAALLLLYFGFTLLANFFGAAFNGLLAEKVEAFLEGGPPAGGGLGRALRDIVPAMVNELHKFSYYLLWAVPLLVLFVVPGLQLIAPVLWVAFSAWILALEYTEYPMENHRIRFRQVRRTLAGRRMMSLGFGAAVLVLMLVPVVNVLVMPAAVAGATAMWVERLRRDAP